MDYITIATLAKPFGLKGEIYAYSLTEFPEERFKKGQRVFARSKNAEPLPLTIKSCRYKGDQLILSFEEITSIEGVEGLKGMTLDMDKEEATLPEGYFRFSDLMECSVYDEQGNLLGKVESLTSYSPTKNLKIKKASDGKCFYVPFIDAYVPKVDLKRKEIVLHVVEGML